MDRNEVPGFVKKIANWLRSHDTGVSSETMAAIALGADEGYFDAPHDNSDFGRCYRLVKIVPEIRGSFSRISELVPQFKAILANWDELCSMYEKDKWSKELYHRIKCLRGDRK